MVCALPHKKHFVRTNNIVERYDTIATIRTSTYRMVLSGSEPKEQGRTARLTPTRSSTEVGVRLLDKFVRTRTLYVTSVLHRFEFRVPTRQVPNDGLSFCVRVACCVTNRDCGKINDPIGGRRGRAIVQIAPLPLGGSACTERYRSPSRLPDVGLGPTGNRGLV